jgi:hypothetical protein
MPSNWFFFKRVEPVTGKIKENATKKSYLMKVLRSKKAQELQIGQKLYEFVQENSDPLIVSNFVDDILSDESCETEIDTWVDNFVNKMANPLKPDPLDKPNTKTGDSLPHPVDTAAANSRPRGAREVEKKDVNSQQKAATMAIQDLAKKLSTGGTVGETLSKTNDFTGKESKDDMRASNTDPNPGSSTIPGTNAYNKFSEQTEFKTTGTNIDENGNVIGKGTTTSVGGFGMNKKDMEAVDKNTRYIDPDTTQDLRSYDKEAESGDMDALYSAENKLMSNIEFEQFSYVPPGFGNGADNKLFRMDNNRKRKIEWDEPMYKPRAYDGPESGITPLPPQWKNTMNAQTYFNAVAQEAQKGMFKLKSKKLDIQSCLPDDIFSRKSDKLLPNRKTNILRPIIDNCELFQSTRIPCGNVLDNTWRDFRTAYDPYRVPESRSFSNRSNSIRPSIARQGILGNYWMQ